MLLGGRSVWFLSRRFLQGAASLVADTIFAVLFYYGVIALYQGAVQAFTFIMAAYSAWGLVVTILVSILASPVLLFVIFVPAFLYYAIFIVIPICLRDQEFRKTKIAAVYNSAVMAFIFVGFSELIQWGIGRLLFWMLPHIK